MQNSGTDTGIVIFNRNTKIVSNKNMTYATARAML